MSARNMVRNLRDSGALDGGARPSRIRRNLKLVIAAVGFGPVGGLVGVPQRLGHR